MKLVRYGDKGSEKPGLLDAGGAIRDLSGEIGDVAGAALLPETRSRLAALEPATLPRVSGAPRLGACVGSVGKVIGIGLNYSDHAAETGMTPPSEPIIFMKATSAICGPFDDIDCPPGSEKLDWEVELGVVIGLPAKNIERATAMNHVAGYCTVNDVSERGFQIDRMGQWTKGKSYDSFAPLGPWLVTADEVADPQALALMTDIDGARMQDGSTATMIFGVAHLVTYLSRFMTLEPGDVIATGTPPGVGMGRKPPVYLRPGQVVELEVEGLGRQRHRVVAD